MLGVLGIGDGGDIIRRQLFGGAIYHGADITRIDKQRLALAVAIAFGRIGCFRFGHKPQPHRDLCDVEQLAGQGDHAVDQIVFDHLCVHCAAKLPVVIIVS